MISRQFSYENGARALKLFNLISGNARKVECWKTRSDPRVYPVRESTWIAFNLRPPETILEQGTPLSLILEKITSHFAYRYRYRRVETCRYAITISGVAGSFILRAPLFTFAILRELISSFIPRGATKSHGSLQNCN